MFTLRWQQQKKETLKTPFDSNSFKLNRSFLPLEVLVSANVEEPAEKPERARTKAAPITALRRRDVRVSMLK